ncbi:unnamed protein product [Blepharisma stoltei]|uniref:Cytosolic carboxypeptidase N-terminal domain-containing protein n=1 Tax=Blepharisma stoltei TaxID=1481888 RepID=A0AAU9KBJ8_9CILI|nr:unnamed protein product [Blepharisma stoltei]
MTTTTPHSSQEWKFDNDEFNEIRPGSSRYHLFRYEGNGILVFDSHSRRSDELLYEETNKIVAREPLPEFKNKKAEKIYEYDRIQYLNMRNYTSNKKIPCEYTLVIPQDSLKFESKFEGGNLRKAIRVSENEYNLLLEFDTETEGYTQWYYFAVENNKADANIRFNIVNLMKYDSLYNDGMQPLVKSLRDGGGWKRAGYNVSYYQNSYQRPISTPNKPVFYYTLTFSYKFEYPNDQVFFAYCYPYTYTQLLAYLGSFKTHEKILRIESLCKTLGDNSCPILTITRNVLTYPSLDFLSVKQKYMYSTMKYNFKDKLKFSEWTFPQERSHIDWQSTSRGNQF